MNNSNVVCTICARGGSKGVPGKNVRPLFGKPLIAYSVERALETGLFEAVAVSSDSQEILDAAGAAAERHRSGKQRRSRRYRGADRKLG